MLTKFNTEQVPLFIRYSTATKYGTPNDTFVRRHIGPRDEEVEEMVKFVGFDSLESFTKAAVPSQILLSKPYEVCEPVSESEHLKQLSALLSKNQVKRSFLGQGFYGTHTPNVILRNILENPAW